MTEPSRSDADARFTSPFEVVYTCIYAVSLGGIALDLVTRTRHTERTEWVMLSLLFGLFVCFQFLRMYSYLHTFDKVLWSSQKHFIQCVTGAAKICDRIIRLGLASLLILATKAHLDAGMIRLRLWPFERRLAHWAAPQSEGASPLFVALDERLDLVTVYSLWLIFVFWLLIVWDLNVCGGLARLGRRDPTAFDEFKETVRRFFYLDDVELESLKRNGAAYFACPKFHERVFGVLFSIGMLMYAANPTPFSLVAAVIPLVLFCISLFREARGELRTIFTLIVVLWEYLELHELKLALGKRTT